MPKGYPTNAYLPRLRARSQDTAWQSQGECFRKGNEAFYPNDTTEESEQAAKAMCRACPVRPECLDYAIVANENYGVWGGLNEREREKVRRKRQERLRRGAA